MNFYPVFLPIGVPSGGSLGWKGMMLYIGFMFGMLAELIGLGIFGLSNPFGVDILFANPIFFVLHFILGFTVGAIIVIRTCRDEIIEDNKKYVPKEILSQAYQNTNIQPDKPIITREDDYQVTTHKCGCKFKTTIKGGFGYNNHWCNEHAPRGTFDMPNIFPKDDSK